MELNHDLIGSIVLAVVSSAYFKKIMDLIIGQFKLAIKKRSNDLSDIKSVLDDGSDLHDCLASLIKNTKAERALIVKISNGGGNPRPDKSLYSSVIYEKLGSLPSIKTDWQNQELDAWHMNFLSDLIKNKKINLITTDIQEDTAIKNVYKAQGIVGSKVIKLFRSKNNLLYLTLNYTESFEDEIETNNQVNASAIFCFDCKTKQLKSIFQKYRKIISEI